MPASYGLCVSTPGAHDATGGRRPPGAKEEPMATESVVASIEGPKGKADIMEVTGDGGPTTYAVSFSGQETAFLTLGEAYIEAGEMTGNPT